MQTLKTIFSGSRETAPTPLRVLTIPEKKLFYSIPQHPAYLAPLPDALPFEEAYPLADPEKMIALMNHPDFIAYIATHKLDEQLQDAEKSGSDISTLRATFTIETIVCIGSALAKGLEEEGYNSQDLWTGAIIAHGEVRQPVIPSRG